MTLILRGNFWWYRFSVGGREYYHSTKCKKGNKAEAKLIEEQAYKELVLGAHHIRRAPSLHGIAAAWMASHGKTKSASHQRAARQSLESLKPLHDLALTDITPGIISGWMAGFLPTHSQASANTCLRYLKLWLRWAQEEGYLRDLPKIKIPKPPDRERPIVSISKVDEFLAACARISPQVPVAVRFAMMLSMREAEILRSQWQDIGAESITINGKGGKIRRVNIPAPVWEALGWYALALQGDGPAQLPRLGLIFPAADGKPHRQGWLRRPLQRGADALGIPILGIHRLRATFATLHLRKGTPLKEVQTMMGHSDPRTTLIYHETSMEEQAKHQAELWKNG